MKESVRTVFGSLFLIGIAAFLSSSSSTAQSPGFHNAPASAKQKKNPLAGQAGAIQAGQSLFAKCATCHGQKGEGTGSVPALNGRPTQSASDGEIFWYISKGDLDNGMPSWSSLPEKQRWQIVAYIRTLGHLGAGHTTASAERHPAPTPAAAVDDAPPPQAPFTDYRFEKPGPTQKITPADLPVHTPLHRPATLPKWATS